MRGTSFRRTVQSVALLFLIAGCAPHARVEGTIVPPKSAAGGSKQLQKTIVWVESKHANERAPGTLEVRLTDDGYEPEWESVPVGTRLRLRNDSGVFHTPFSPDPNGGFHLAPLRPGDQVEITLSRPGELRLFCELHSEATSVLLVLPAGEYARPDAAGHFRLAGLPSGPVVVSYWHPDWGSGRRRIDVPQKGLVELQLKF